jgi:Aerotolerance regulator N-terminal/von Willebrand factor type A domain
MFALAGAVAAAGPVVIHLLNRRRFRVISWAAMDFLREAVKRNRRILKLRDILLLILRTAAVLLFGLALARPYFASSGSGQLSPGQPIHAILLVDNSMSMGYRQAGQTLLDDAKAKGQELIDALPDGSRVSVIPLCGGGAFSRDAYRTKQDADEALKKIEVTDRAMTSARAMDLAKEAMQQAIDVREEKRIILLGDQQVENWKGASLAPQLKALPELQVVDLSSRNPENTSISEFRLLDGLADISTPARFVAKVTHQGRAPRLHVQVTLSIDGAEVQSKTIDSLNPEQTVEVTFEYQFTDPPEPGQVRWSSAKVSLPPDRLEIDDSRSMVVPVVAALPVIFVDQYGETEDAKRNRLGETRQLRALLAPQNVHGQTQMHLVRVLKRRIDQLDVKELRDARLVVIAGVARPEVDNVRLLREYVRQGGQLVIAAGAEFDPAAWNEQAWLGGAGILPLPLKPQSFGHTPDEATSDFNVFSLKVAPSDVPNSAYLQLPDTDPQDIADSLREPTFFKTVVPIEDKAVTDKMISAEVKRIEQERGQLADINAQIQSLSEKELRGQLEAADRAALERAQRKRDEIVPNWLLFDSARDREGGDLSPEELAARSKPKVQLRYDNQIPFLVEREIGRGRVLFFTSGFLSSWNDLPTKNAIWLVDRVLRSRIEYTLPERNVDTASKPIVVPINASERNEQFYLVRPNGKEQLLEVERVGREEFGVTVSDFAQRGLYRVAIRKPQSATGDAAVGKSEKLEATKLADKKSHDELIAANGPVEESKLTAIDEAGAAAKLRTDGETAPHYRWVARGEPISLTGAEVWGQDTWWWLILIVFCCLFMELAILAWPAMVREREVAQ